MREIFRYAIASGKADIDPVPSLRGALKPSPKGHHAAITPDELPAFLRALEKIEGRMFVPTKVMFRLMMMTFSSPACKPQTWQNRAPV